MSKEETERRMQDREGYNKALKGESPALDKGVLDKIEESTLGNMKVEDTIEEETKGDKQVDEIVEEVIPASSTGDMIEEELKVVAVPETKPED